MITMCLLINSNATFCQEYLYEYKRILVDPTFTDNQVYSIAKDKHGIIWLGASIGLFRFDGYSTEKINYNSDNAKHEEKHISKIALYGDTLFIGDYKGIHAINCLSHQPINLNNTPGTPIVGVVADTSGVWWLDEKGTLTHYFQNKQRSFRLPIENVIVRAEVFLDAHDLWIKMNSTLGNFTLVFNKTSMSVENKMSVTGKHDNVRKIRKSENGNIYLISLPQSYSWNRQSKQLNALNDYGEQLCDLLHVNNETFTINNSNRLYHYFKGDSGITKTLIPLGAGRPESIYEIYDINHSIYAATSNGLVIVKYTRNLFQSIFSTYNATDNSFLVPRGITEDENNYYLATYQKLISYHKNSNCSEIILNDAMTARSLLKDADTLWIGTEGGAIQQFILPDKQLRRIPINNNSDWYTIICLAHLDENRILAGGLKNLLLFDKRTHQTTEIPVKLNGKNICENNIYQIIVLNAHKILIATGMGIFMVNEQGTILNNYSQQLKESESLRSFCMVVGTDNSIWAGTENGVFQLDKNGNVLTHLTRNEGLAGNMVISLVPDLHNHLWAASYTGLSAIEKSSKTINNFYKEDGLPDNEFNHSSFLLSRDNSILLGSVNGFIRFEPHKVNLNQYDNLHLNISKIEYGNQQQKNTRWMISNDNQNPIKLGKGINYVRLQFFIDPVDVFRNSQYEYKIEGIHTDWISLGNMPVLHIDNFKPGNYNLLIRAITGSGSRYIITKTYPIVVEQYFYTTTWFYVTILSVILLLIILYLITVVQRNKKIMNIRQLIAQDLHDEIGGYLTGINMNLELLQKNRENEVKYFNTIRTLGQSALLALKDSLWSLNSTSDTAQELWDWVKNIAAETYENLGIDTQFHQIDGLEKIKLSMLEKSYLIYVIKECITNSIKYGDRKLVRFDWSREHGKHIIKISNKIGNQKALFKNRYGLDNISNRMKHIKGLAFFTTEQDYFIVTIQLNFIS